jgi:hypothetical protein
MYEVVISFLYLKLLNIFDNGKYMTPEIRQKRNEF